MLYMNQEFLDDNMSRNENYLSSVQTLLGRHAKNHYQSFSQASQNLVELSGKLDQGALLLAQVKDRSRATKEGCLAHVRDVARKKRVLDRKVAYYSKLQELRGIYQDLPRMANTVIADLNVANYKLSDAHVERLYSLFLEFEQVSNRKKARVLELEAAGSAAYAKLFSEIIILAGLTKFVQKKRKVIENKLLTIINQIIEN
jgi:hypothetical protein